MHDPPSDHGRAHLHFPEPRLPLFPARGALGGCVQRVTLDDDEVCEGAGGQDADAVLGEGGVRCRGGEPAEGLERREALSGVPARGESCESAF